MSDHYYSNRELEFSREVFSRPGINIIHEVIKPASRIKPYAIRVDVEPLHDGHAAQQSEQNALPKQHATDEPKEPIHRPIVKDEFRRNLYVDLEKQMKICLEINNAGKSWTI